MKVTNVKIKKVDGDKFDRLRAYVDVTLWWLLKLFMG